MSANDTSGRTCPDCRSPMFTHSYYMNGRCPVTFFNPLQDIEPAAAVSANDAEAMTMPTRDEAAEAALTKNMCLRCGRIFRSDMLVGGYCEPCDAAIAAGQAAEKTNDEAAAKRERYLLAQDELLSAIRACHPVMQVGRESCALCAVVLKIEGA